MVEIACSRAQSITDIPDRLPVCKLAKEFETKCDQLVNPFWCLSV